MMEDRTLTEKDFTIQGLEQDVKMLQEQVDSWHSDASSYLLALFEKQAEVNGLKVRVQELEVMLKDAHLLFGRHNGHFDRTGGRGTGCPVCVEQRELRAKHDAILAALHAPAEAKP
jgi:hypothetical protein